MSFCCHDLHCHILPGLDDGSPDDEISQAMLQLAGEAGTCELFATPHVISGSWQPSWQTICTLTDGLNQVAAAQQLAVRIQPGAEVAMDWSLLELLAAPGPYCLAGGRFILVELPLGHLPTYADEFLFALQTRDFLPILAHPERNPDVKADPARLSAWLERGIFAQLNSSSLLGSMGRKTQETAEALLALGSIHFLGSDAHGMGVRRPDLRPAKEKLVELLGEAGAATILSENPQQLLAGRPEAIRAPQALARAPAKRGWRDKMKSLWA